MRRIRRLVYRLGFRPRLGSIFHSPSLEMEIVGREMTNAFREGLERHDLP